MTDKIDMASYRVQQTSTEEIALVKEDGYLEPPSEVGTAKGDERALLSEIIQYVNEVYGTDFTDEDKLSYFADDMERRLLDREGLRQALDPEINPPDDVRRLAFGDFFDDVLEDMMEANTDIYRKITEDERLADVFRICMFNKIQRSLSESPG